MSKHYRRTIDVNKEDVELLERFIESVKMLTGLTEEAFVTNKTYLLSPILRKIIADKGREVDKLCGKLSLKLCVDNPGEPIK